MEYPKLNYFLAVAQTLNFRKAAEKCMVAQPVLSRQIATLEEELGVRLFDRTRKKVALTPAGYEFIEYARGVLELIEQGHQAMAELKAGERGVIYVGCVETLVTGVLPTVFAGFNCRYPNIRLQLSVKGADDLLRMVESGLLDFGLFGLSSDHTLTTTLEELVVQELYRDRLQVIVSPSHPFASRKGERILLEMVAKEPLILLREGFGARRVVDRVFAQRGFKVQPIVEADLLHGVIEFVKQGIGISLLPGITSKNELKEAELVTLPVADLYEEFSFALVYRRYGTLSTAARVLIKSISNAIKT